MSATCPHCGGEVELTLSAPRTLVQRAVERTAEDPLFEVVRASCALFSVRASDLLTNSRTPHVVRARAVAAYVLRTAYGISYPKIGQLLGTDHSTAMSAVERCGRLVQHDQAVAAAVARLMGQQDGQEQHP